MRTNYFTSTIKAITDALYFSHFHWQFFVKHIIIDREQFFRHTDAVEWQRRVAKYGKKAQEVKRDWARNNNANLKITLNEAIAILQRSYGRSINKTKGWTGRLFRDNCQAKDGWIDGFVTLPKNGNTDFRFLPGNDYGFRCLNYIHKNAVKANIVAKETDYTWSSAKDYAGLRNGTLCNLEIGRQLKGFIQ